MFWFLHNVTRLNSERDALAVLDREAEWLSQATWLFEGSILCLDAMIEAHEHSYSVRMRFPAVFPSSPPTVIPRGSSERWSGHQYGAGGELCLEWGPDTWHPDVTGAQVLKSAFKLLYAENPHGTGTLEAVPSRHSLSLGQELRTARIRFGATTALTERVRQLEVGAPEAVEICIISQRESLMTFVLSAGSSDSQKWTDPVIPEALREGSKVIQGIMVKISDTSRIPRIRNHAAMQEFLSEKGVDTSGLPLQDKDGGICPIIVCNSTGPPQLFLFLDDTSQTSLSFRTLQIDTDRTGSRNPPQFEQLQQKRIGIVGLGSAGSKIALSLARSGIRKFTLIDDDIFLPGNMPRHTLDWLNIGEHKVDGVARQLERLTPKVEIKTHRIRLSGQESTAAAASAFNSLVDCDLILDATADPATFNQLAGVADQHEKALVWLEIFAGGFGGLVARHRPRLDPSPHAMRHILNQVLSETNLPAQSSSDSYSFVDNEDNVHVASDSDVGAIADHSTRMVIDSLLDLRTSLFPHSIYLVGLERDWIFEAPFHTIPVATDGISVSDPEAMKLLDGAAQEGLEFLEGILKRMENENTYPS